MNSEIQVLIIYFLGTFVFLFLVGFLLEKFMPKLSKAKKTFILTMIIGIVFVIALIYKLYKDNWQISDEFILNLVVVISFLILSLILRREYLKNKEIEFKYEVLENYLQTSVELLDKYSSTIHKYKNNLIAIKGYMKDNLKDANIYVDKLLDSYKTKKYKWIRDVNYIQIETLRYLIYYKLSKAEDLNLNIVVDISKELKKLKDLQLSFLDNNILLEVLGEYFDNAMVASRESIKKELNLSIFFEESNLVFVLANTYHGKIKLEEIEKCGYTTKGRGHGRGLYEVAKSLKKHEIFQYDYLVDNDYFWVKLAINNNYNIL